MAGLEVPLFNQGTLTDPKGGQIRGCHTNQDTLTGPKGGQIRGSPLFYNQDTLTGPKGGPIRVSTTDSIKKTHYGLTTDYGYS